MSEKVDYKDPYICGCGLGFRSQTAYLDHSCRENWEKLKPADPVNHPPHYNKGKIEPIDVIKDWGLGFCLGNTVKYIARCFHKGSTIQDLEKARWYLDREIADLKAAQQKEGK